jgi:N-acetylglucosaminyldiphosphoundecaprenol N-acetyl-beta-D-mannosaminyltransferase
MVQRIKEKECIVTNAVEFAGLTFRGLTSEALLERREEMTVIVTVNADFIVRAKQERRLAGIISNEYSTFDGQVPYWLAKLMARPKQVEFEKISGSDFAYSLLAHAAEHNKKVFFLGAATETNYSAREVVRRKYGIEIDGYSPPLADYPFPVEWEAEAMKRIRDFEPDYLFVALGMLKQEYWIDDNRETLQKLGVEIAIGCGGTLDFISGRIRRAPKWVQTAGLEGVYRLLMERKLFRLTRLFRSFLIFFAVLR